MPLQVIIADDHLLLLDGLRAVIDETDDMKVAATVHNGRALIDCLQKILPDIILMDLNMPHLDGIDTLKILQKNFPQLKVIILTSYFQSELIKEIKLLGAKGYLLKNSSTYHLKEAIRQVAAGGFWFDEKIAHDAASASYFIDDFMKKYQLTKREVEIIRMVGEGLTSKEIGEKLFVSEFTVNAHRRNISRKLDIHTPVGLLNFAKEQGLV